MSETREVDGLRDLANRMEASAEFPLHGGVDIDNLRWAAYLLEVGG